MNRSRLALVVALAMAALVAGCPAPAVIPQTFNFDRPADVELICLRVPVLSTGLLNTLTGAIIPRPLSDCVVDPTTNITPRDAVPENDDPSMPATATSPTYGFRLFALVTQSNRGELAVVALHPTFNTGIQDNDRRIPGFTFIPVGRFPGAIAVDPRGVDSLAAFADPNAPRGGVTYVANTGENTISVLDNARLLSPDPNRLPLVGYNPLNQGGSPTLVDTSMRPIDAFVELHTMGAPRDVAVVPRGPDCATNGPMCRYILYATVPDLGIIQSWDVTNPRQPASPQVTHVMAAAAMRVDGGMDGGMDATAGGGAEAGADAGASAPFPTQMALDSDGLLYVADEHQPIIHVFDPDPMMVGGLVEHPQPIVTTVGTRALAISPRLPVDETLTSDALTGKRFVYAIANPDGTVIVLDPDAPTAGPLRVNLVADRPECIPGNQRYNPNQCPRLNPLEARFDRLPLLGPASAITFVDRDVATRPECVQPRVNPEDTVLVNGTARGSPLVQRCNPDATGDPGAGPRNLRGVQAIVALQSGPLQVVDLRDPDRACLTAVRTVNVTVNGNPVPRGFLPNVPRSAQLFTPGPAITNGPNLVINNTANSGGSEGLPHIVPLDGSNSSCDSTSTPQFCVLLPQIPRPSSLMPTDTFVSAVDPLATRDDTWSITYQGVLPFLTLTTATFRDGPPPADGGPAADSLILDAPGANFCMRGALAGDRVVIASASPLVIEPTVDAGMLPPGLDAGEPDAEATDASAEDAFCRGLFGATATPCNRDLVVTSAFGDHLELAVPLRGPSMINNRPVMVYGDATGCGSPQIVEPQDTGPAIAGTISIADFRTAIRRCFPQAARIEVRAGNNWVVSGVRAGFQHNVITSSTGQCVADASRQPSGRLETDQVYTSPAFTIRIASGTQTVNGTRVPVPPPRNTSFQFTTTGGNFPLAVDGGWLPATLRYSCTNQRLYIVDQTRSSLYEYYTASLVSPRTFN